MPTAPLQYRISFLLIFEGVFHCSLSYFSFFLSNSGGGEAAPAAGAAGAAPAWVVFALSGVFLSLNSIIFLSNRKHLQWWSRSGRRYDCCRIFLSLRVKEVRKYSNALINRSASSRRCGPRRCSGQLDGHSVAGVPRSVFFGWHAKRLTYHGTRSEHTSRIYAYRQRYALGFSHFFPNYTFSSYLMKLTFPSRLCTLLFKFYQ